MKRKIAPKSQRKGAARIHREREPVSWKYVLLTSFCGLILVIGFFGAARQHFASIDYGIRNSKLRKQVEELKSERRRLLLSREVALSPAEIKKSARKIGFTEMTASNIQTFRAEPNESSEKPNANKSEDRTVAGKTEDNLKKPDGKKRQTAKVEDKDETKTAGNKNGKTEKKEDPAKKSTIRKRKL